MEINRHHYPIFVRLAFGSGLWETDRYGDGKDKDWTDRRCWMDWLECTGLWQFPRTDKWRKLRSSMYRRRSHSATRTGDNY